MPPKKTVNGQAEGVDSTAAGAVTALVSPPNFYLFQRLLNNIQSNVMSMRFERVPGMPHCWLQSTTRQY